MLSSSLRLLLAAVSVATTVKGWYPGQDAPGLVRNVDPRSSAVPFNFDVDAGFNVQEQTADEDATVVEYTSDNGSPFPHPYEYQRIGNDGQLHSRVVQTCGLIGSFSRPTLAPGHSFTRVARFLRPRAYP